MEICSGGQTFFAMGGACFEHGCDIVWDRVSVRMADVTCNNMVQNRTRNGGAHWARIVFGDGEKRPTAGLQLSAGSRVCGQMRRQRGCSQAEQRRWFEEGSAMICSPSSVSFKPSGDTSCQLLPFECPSAFGSQVPSIVNADPKSAVVSSTSPVASSTSAVVSSTSASDKP